MHNIFKAIGAIKAGAFKREVTYPSVTATWPNRAVRRAIKKRRESHLPQEWKQFLAIFPDWRSAIMTSRMA